MGRPPGEEEEICPAGSDGGDGGRGSTEVPGWEASARGPRAGDMAPARASLPGLMADGAPGSDGETNGHRGGGYWRAVEGDGADVSPLLSNEETCQQPDATKGDTGNVVGPSSPVTFVDALGAAKKRRAIDRALGALKLMASQAVRRSARPPAGRTTKRDPNTITGAVGPSSDRDRASFDSKKKLFTEDGRRMARVCSMVLVCKDEEVDRDDNEGSPAGPPLQQPLECLKKHLSCRSGANSIYIHPLTGGIVTGGSESPPGSAPGRGLSKESGWVEVWAKQQGLWSWTRETTMTAETVGASLSNDVGETSGSMGVQDSIRGDWDEYIGPILPPVTAIATNARTMLCVTGHGSPLGSLGVSKAATERSCPVVVWNIHKQQAVRIMTGHTKEVTAVIFHKSKPMVLSASKDGTVKLWNYKSGVQEYSIDAHQGGVLCMELHSMMRKYSKPSSDTPEARRGKESNISPALSEGISQSIISQSAKAMQRRMSEIFSKTVDGITHRSMPKSFGPDGEVYSKVDRRIHGQLENEASKAYGDVSRVETFIVTGGQDHALTMWDIETGEKIRVLLGHEREVTAVATHKATTPEADRMASASFDKTVRVWHLASGACIRILQHTRWILSLAFGEAGFLATGCAGGVIKLWDPHSGSLMTKYQGTNLQWVKGLKFVPNSDYLAALDVGGDISIWQWKSGPNSIQRLTSKSTERDVTDHCHNMVLSQDGRYAAVSDHQFRVQLWDLSSGAVQHVLGAPSPSRNSMLRYFSTGLAFHPRRPLLAVAGVDDDVRVYNINTGNLENHLQGHSGRVCCADFSPSGHLLVTGSHDSTARLWDTEKWECIRQLTYHHEWVTAVAFDPTGDLLATGSWDDRLGIYHVGSGAVELNECYSNIWTIKWRPVNEAENRHSTMVAAGTGGGTVHFFAADKLGPKSAWKDAGIIAAHDDVVGTIAWSPDGHFLLTGSLDNSVRLWGVSPSEAMEIVMPKTRSSKAPVLKQKAPLERHGLFAKFPCAVSAVAWGPKPPSSFGKEEEGLAVAICTTTAGKFLLDGTDAGQPAVPYSRLKFIHEMGGRTALLEVVAQQPLSISSMGPGCRMILHDAVADVDLFSKLLRIASQHGIVATMPYGPKPLLAEAYFLPSEATVGAIVDSVVACPSDSASSCFISDVGTATILMLVAGFSDQAARLLSTAGLRAANHRVYVEKWRKYSPRVRMKSGSVFTLGTFTEFPVDIWGPRTLKNQSMKEREIDVIAATTTFQYAAGIPPGEFHFESGFVPLEEDLVGNTGLERSLLHMAFNSGNMEVLDTPMGRALLDYKWNTYGKRAYYCSMTAPLVMIFLTTLQSIAWYMATALRWSEGTDINEVKSAPEVLSEFVAYFSSDSETDAWSAVGKTISVLCFANALFMLIQEARECFKEGMRMYMSSGWNVLDIVVIMMCLVSSSAIFISPEMARAWTQFTCFICWLEVFNMLRADNKFGLIVRMYLNIAKDIRFLIFLQFFLCLGASFSFVGVFRRYDEEIVEEREPPSILRDVWYTLLRVYAMLLGNVDLFQIEELDYPVFYQIMFLLFVYIQTILLMNLVIAMMGESFEKVLQEAQKELTLDRAEVLIRVELSMGVAKMRDRGYLPRYLQVLLPRSELTSEYADKASGATEWAGVAGTVNNQLSRKIGEYADRTEAIVRDTSGKKSDILTESIMGVKKDLKDHLNTLEQRILTTESKESLRAVVREEMAAFMEEFIKHQQQP